MECWRAYQHSGFSVDAGVCIEAQDRVALERLLRYCARPPFKRILEHIGVDSEPPLWDDGGDAQMGEGVEVEPDSDVDQRVNW